jgi:oligopeptide transport system substrate-binding protein
VLITIFITSCQPNPKDNQKNAVRINIGSEPHSLDPRKARDLSDLTLLRMLFDGLTRVSPNEKVEMALAKEVKISEDLKTYTFTLRAAKWTNGDAVSAADFVYAWKKILEPSFPSDNASQLYVIKNGRKAKEGKVSLDEVGVHALDALTLKVELEYPIPYFLDLLASPTFFPINCRMDQNNPRWSEGVESYVCNGPFTLKHWKHHDYLTVSKNATYWDADTVQLASIEMMMVEGDTEYKMFEKKELDWAGSPLSILPIDALPKLKENHFLKTKPFLGTHFIRINTQKAPFLTASMRRAFALAVNRKAIIEHVTQGNQIPATGLVPTSLGLQKEAYFQDSNQEEARTLFEAGLQESGLDRRQLSQITLTYVSGERAHLIAQAMQQQWFEAFGVRIQLQAMEKKVYYDILKKENYQLAMGSWIADFKDPINFLEMFKFKSGGTNNTSWENPHYTELLEASSMVSDQTARLQLLSKSEKLLMDEMPIIPIFHYTMLYVVNDTIKNTFLSSLGSVDFKWSSLEKSGDKR